MLNVVPVAMSGVKQRSFITVVKLLMDKKWLRLPANIKGIRNQFLKYRLPEGKLAQDIVSTFLVLAGLLWALGYSYEIMREAPEEQVPAKPLKVTGPRGQWGMGMLGQALRVSTTPISSCSLSPRDLHSKVAREWGQTTSKPFRNTAVAIRMSIGRRQSGNFGANAGRKSAMRIGRSE